MDNSSNFLMMIGGFVLFFQYFRTNNVRDDQRVRHERGGQLSVLLASRDARRVSFETLTTVCRTRSFFRDHTLFFFSWLLLFAEKFTR